MIDVCSVQELMVKLGNIASMVYTGASVAVVATLAVGSCLTVPTTPVRLWIVLLGPKRRHVLKMAFAIIVQDFGRCIWT